jgi:glycoside/pentoside/hexuronide:cation symporter, GPH family
MSTGKLSIKEKIGYSFGDAAANFVFMTMILFQSKFYTDVFGIEASIAGTLLLVGRLWDAFFDPMMGTLADRTNTRWGKFRPWILWTALPWGVAMVLAYTKPGFGATGMIIYACVTNIMLMTLYSANNTPYSAMTGVITGDGDERTSLSSYRMVASMIAQLIVGGFTLTLVSKFGAIPGSDQINTTKGWQMTILVWAVVCVVLFLITFLTTKERIQPDPKQETNTKQDFSDLLKNGPWIAMFVLTLAHFIYVALRSGAMNYYFDYFVNRDQIFNLLQSIGLTRSGDAASGSGNWLLNTLGLIVKPDRSNVASVGFSLFNMWSQGITVIGVACSTMLTIKFGKKLIAITGFVLTTLFMIGFYFLPKEAVGSMFVLEFLRALTYAPTIPLIWSMFADVVDYAEWKTGRRTTGIIYAAIIFGLKAGLSLGGAIGLWLLAGYGYQPPVDGVPILQQAPQTLTGIRMIISVYPAIFLGIVVVCLVSYKINRKMNIQIQEELTQRRKAFQF